MMTSKQIRQSFLDFFASKGHKIVPSAPIGADGTILCPFDAKKSKNDWRICLEVIIIVDSLMRLFVCSLRSRLIVESMNRYG